MPDLIIKISSLPQICGGKFLSFSFDERVNHLLTDSRRISALEGSVFFCIQGERHDGHDYIPELYKKGIRNFVVEKEVDIAQFESANVLMVTHAIEALQKVVSAHRSSFDLPVIGITGSNGKTIVKEWLYQLLNKDFAIVKNPGSYNSQIGVPLSVWGIEQKHQLGIFEAGISKPNEMAKLQAIIQPSIGIFTNIGPAHAEGFSSIEEKIQEKLKLFGSVKILVFCADHKLIKEAIKQTKLNTLRWGFDESSDIKITQISEGKVELQWKKNFYAITIPFSDKALIENCLHCIAVMLHFNYSEGEINNRIRSLSSVSMRLELKRGIANTYIIDDTYNNDLAGLAVALNYLESLPQKNKALILSDIFQSGLPEDELYQRISQLVSRHKLSFFVGIGERISLYRQLFHNAHFYQHTDNFIEALPTFSFSDEVILIKGARVFSFEKIVRVLQQKHHHTVLEINLSSFIGNFNKLKTRLKPKVKVMAMVKALAYGSGIEEIASTLQYHKVDYLGVAYADEGMQLRLRGISTPIMIMNPGEASFETCLAHDLEPEIFSIRMLRILIESLRGRSAKIHLKIETGMHRLGIEESEIPEAVALLKSNPQIRIVSVLTHLSASDSSTHDAFTRQQVDKFQRSYQLISEGLSIKPLRHVLNSAGVLRFPEYQFEMVRFGIAMYGVAPSPDLPGLDCVLSLKSVISQIKELPAGASVGYGREALNNTPRKIATIAIGYADGFSRSLSKGKGKVLVHGKLAPVIGNVCMDMTMIDITDIEANEGDEVLIFGKDLPVELMADWAGTIPYEILARIGERVKRVFQTDSF